VLATEATAARRSRVIEVLTGIQEGGCVLRYCLARRSRATARIGARLFVVIAVVFATIARTDEAEQTVTFIANSGCEQEMIFLPQVRQWRSSVPTSR
jgi:hypothetical protein